MKTVMKTRKKRLRKEDGTVFLAALIAMVILIGLVMGLLAMSAFQGKAVEAGYQLQRTLYIAEAGVDAAAFELLQEQDGILEEDFGGGYYTVNTYNLLETNGIDDDGDGEVDEEFETDAEGNLIMRIVSVGHLEQNQQAIEVDVKVLFTNTFGYAAIARGGIEMTGNCLINSYKSSLVDYPEEQLLGNGDIGTVDIGLGIIDVGGSSLLNGDAFVGVGGSPQSDIVITGSGGISGNKAALPEEIALPSVVVPNFQYDEVGDMILQSGEERTLVPGNYYVPNFGLKSGSVLNVGVGYEGEINIVVEYFDAYSAAINIPGNVHVNIYVTDALLVTSNVVINDPNGTDVRSTPQNLTIYGAPTLAEATFTGSSRTFAAIYMPDTDLTIIGNTELMGAVVASTLFEGQGDARLYLDEDLILDMVDMRRVLGARSVSWREVAAP